MDEKISLHFYGKRFERKAYPMNSLDDLKYLNEMVTKVANLLYKRDNSSRTRAPKGFNEISLCISDITSGSTVVECTIPNYSNQMTFGPTADQLLFYKAYDEVTAYLSMSKKIDEDPEIGAIIRPFLGKFGKSLKDDEGIEFKHNLKSSAYNKEVRAQLVKDLPKYAKDVEMYITVDGMVVSEREFTAKYVDDYGIIQDVTIPFGEYSKETINEAMMNNNSRRVLIKGTGWFKKDKLQTVELDSFELLDALDIQARIDDLTSLKDGWADNGKGRGIDRKSALSFADMYEEKGPCESPSPYIYPTIEGGLELEWDNDRYILIVYLQDQNAELIDLKNDGKEYKLDLKNDADWSLLKTLVEEGYNVG